jgi:hypothetical protein
MTWWVSIQLPARIYEQSEMLVAGCAVIFIYSLLKIGLISALFEALALSSILRFENHLARPGTAHF